MRFEKQDLWNLGLIVIAGSIFMVLGLGSVGNQAQVYNEYIVETIASNGSNKSGELMLFWILLFGGVTTITIIYWVLYRKKSINLECSRLEKESIKAEKGIYIIVSLLACNIVAFIIQGNMNTILICLTFLAIFYYKVCKSMELKFITFSILLFYDFVAISYIVYKVFNIQINSNIIAIITVGLSILCVKLFNQYLGKINKAILISQALLPLLLLFFLVNEYRYNNEIIVIPVRIQEYLFWGTLIIISWFFIIKKIRANWSKTAIYETKDLISIVSCMLISVFNINSGAMKYITSDLHHPAESIIAFQQIFDMGQRAFENYYPVSGMFSVLLGGILDILGGKMTYYYMASMILLGCIAALITYLCRYYVNNMHCLFIAAIFSLGSAYSRTYLILPTVLIFALPKLIENKNLWLKVWIILSLAGGLYYPLYGVATFLGSMPFGIYQFVTFVRSEEFIRKRKSIKFYIYWLITISIVCSFVPLLWKMAKHTIAYASQSVLADGIAVFGQSVPDGFMQYLSNSVGIRIACYYSIRFILPSFIVWIFAMIFIKFIIQYNKQYFEQNQGLFLMSTFGLIALPISYTYTMVRADIGCILSRSAEVIIPMGLILILLISFKYLRDNMAKYIVIGICMAIVIILGRSNLNNVDNHLVYYNNISSDKYAIITDKQSEDIGNLGTGFVANGLTDSFEKYREITNELLSYDANLSFYGLAYEYYYNLGIKSCAQASTFAIKSYSSSKETIDVIEKEHPVIFGVGSSVIQYYLYYWLMNSDEYVYSPKYEAFLPHELAEKIVEIQIIETRNVNYLSTDLGKIANSLGRSKDTLIGNVLKKTDYTANLANTTKEIGKTGTENTTTFTFVYNLQYDLQGTDADFLYLNLSVENMKQNTQSISHHWHKYFAKDIIGDDIIVKISWASNKVSNSDSLNYVTCTLNNGELMIPLGVNVNWLLNNHQQLTITVSGLPNDSNVTVKELMLLKSDASTLNY